MQLGGGCLVDVDDAVLERLCEHQQLFKERLVSERNPNVRHVGLVNVVTDWSVLRIVAAEPVLLLLYTRAMRQHSIDPFRGKATCMSLGF